MRTLLTLLAALGATVGLSSPAIADISFVQTWTDPAGDATPASDITRVTMTDGDVLRADVADLGAAGLVRVTYAVGEDRLVFSVNKQPGATPRVDVGFFPRQADGSYGPWTTVRCGSSATWDAAGDHWTLRPRLSACAGGRYDGLATMGSVSLATATSKDVVPTPGKGGVHVGSAGFTDAIGDAAPRADIRGGRLTKTGSWTQVTTAMTNLRGYGRYVLTFEDPRHAIARVVVQKEYARAPVATVAVQYYDTDVTGWHRVPCAVGFTWDAGNDLLAARVPYSCAPDGAGFNGYTLRSVHVEAGGASDSARVTVG